MTSVFISHSSNDRAFVETELVPFLHSYEIESWFSSGSIRTSDEWEREIRKALLNCQWFLVVISPDSVASDWVQTEVHWAIKNRRNKIIPLLLRDCDPDNLHLKLARIQFVDFREGVQSGFPSLLSAFCEVPEQLSSVSKPIFTAQRGSSKKATLLVISLFTSVVCLMAISIIWFGPKWFASGKGANAGKPEVQFLNDQSASSQDAKQAETLRSEYSFVSIQPAAESYYTNSSLSTLLRHSTLVSEVQDQINIISRTGDGGMLEDKYDYEFQASPRIRDEADTFSDPAIEIVIRNDGERNAVLSSIGLIINARLSVRENNDLSKRSVRIEFQDTSIDASGMGFGDVRMVDIAPVLIETNAIHASRVMLDNWKHGAVYDIQFVFIIDGRAIKSPKIFLKDY